LALLFYDRALKRRGEREKGRKGERALPSPFLPFSPSPHLSIEESAFSNADQPSRAGWQPAGGDGIPSRPTIATLLFLTLGLLTHENGLFIFPALVGLDWLRRPGSTIAQRARRLWPLAVPPALFAVLWLLIPKSSEQGLNSLSAIGRNVVPFLQTLVYPLLPLLRLDSGDVWVLVLAAVMVVGLFGLLAWRAGAGRLWLFGLGWFALSALPALLFLQPAYVYGSPRLSYLPSIGAGLLWAVPVVWLVGRRWMTQVTSDELRVTTPVVRRDEERSSLVTRNSSLVTLLVVVLVVTLAPLLPPVTFIRCQLAFYAETSRFARLMAAAGAAAPDGEEVVFVNAPFFFSSTAALPDGCPSPYPWTPVGGILIPPYAQARDFVRFNGGPDRPTDGVTYAGFAPGWRTFGPEVDGAALRQVAAEDAAYVFDLSGGAFRDLSAAWQPDAGAAESPLATFGGALQLAGAQVAIDDQALTATLDWRVLGAPEEPLAAFVHVYNAAGELVAQSDGPPGDGLAPQALWQPGDGLQDTRRIDLPAVMPGAYSVAVGVYRTAGGARLAAEADGQPLPDDVLMVDTFEIDFSFETIP